MASRRVIFSRMACWRKSGVVLMTPVGPSYSNSREGRVRWACGSADVHTRQLHPIVGTPIDVPLPKTVSMAFISWLSFLGVYFLSWGGAAPGLVAEVATALVISIQAMLSSNSTFCIRC